MTIANAIGIADELHANMVDINLKLRWLSELDGRIFLEIMKPYADTTEFPGYDENTPHDTELLAPYPYDTLYTAYLEQELSKAGSELVRYNNAREIFNERYSAFARWYVRTHSAPSPSVRFKTRRY